jgi:restriction system protein
MPIPDFESLMLPYLELLHDGQEHGIQDVISQLSIRFNLTDEERYQRSPNSPNIIFNNRVGWAKTYLKKARLIENPHRGIVKISDRGLQILTENPQRIDIHYLSRFPEFMSFYMDSVEFPEENPSSTQTSNIPINPNILTPSEQLEQSYQDIRSELADDLLEHVLNCSPRFFEHLVIDLLLKMGYGGFRDDAAQMTPRSHDGGIDGIINEDKLGLDVIHLQAKRWSGNVGRPEVQTFVGSLEGFRANKGIFITTSDFTSEAQEYVKTINKKVILINGKKLTQLMIDHGVGVTEIVSYVVKRVDNDYFIEE